MEQLDINLIGFYMEQALARMTETLASALLNEGIDLPHSQYAVLRLIYSRQEPMTQIMIAETLKKNAAAIKRTVDILERKGLVTREAQSGRSNYVLPTAKALSLKESIITTANKTLHEVFDKFNDKELSVFINVLRLIDKPGNR